MSYIEQETKLNKVLETLPIPTEKLLNGETPIDLLYATGRDFELTINDIGELCELVQQIITKERKPEDFEAGLKEKLEFGDDTILVGNVLATVTQKIFLKLLPALNIKVPLDMAMATVVNPITTSPTSQEGVKGVEMIGDFDKTKDSNESADTPIQVSDLKFTGNLAQRAPKAGAPLPTFPQVSPEPPVQLTKPAVQVPLSSTIPLISNQSGETIPAKKPPMVEVSANQVPENSIESLMKMLRGSVSERELQTHLSKLPESLRVALESVDSAKKVVEIGQKYALHVDKIGDLATETGMVILGFTHPGQFLPRLTRRLGMNENTIRPLAQEINTEIFLKIREALKEINGEGGIHISPEPQARMVPISRPSQTQNNSTFGNKSVSGFNQPLTVPTKPSTTAKISEEELSREDILRDIENPTPFHPEQTSQVFESSRPLATPTFPQKPSSLPTSIPSKPIEKPSIPVTINNLSIEIRPEILPSTIISKIPVEIKIVPPPSIVPIEKVSPLPQQPPIATASTEAVPINTTNYPPKKSVVEEKLFSATTSAKSTKQYSIDPYKEPLE